MTHFPSTNDRQCPTTAVCCPKVSSFTFLHLFLTADWISLEEETSKSLHFSICLRSGHGVSHIAVNSSHTPLQYIAPDQTSAEVTALPDAGVTNRKRRVCSLLMLLRTPQSFHMVISTPPSACPQVSLKLPPWMQDDLNLLVYYRGSPSLSAVVERKDPKASPGE